MRPETSLKPEDLEQAVHRYRSFLELSSEGIWCFEFDPPIPLDITVDERIALCLERGVLTECNAALSSMYRYESPERLRGTPLSSFLDLKQSQSLELLRAFFHQGLRLIDAESRELDRDGNLHIFLNNLTGMVSDGELVRVWGTQRDVTETKRIEERLQQVQKMEALGQLAGGVAHDLNNLLMVIGGNLSLALDSASPPVSVMLENASRATEQSAALTQKLLAFSRRSPMRFEVLDLRSVIEGTTAMLRAVIPDSIQVETRVDESVEPIWADRLAVKQVLVNLVLNARDSMPDGGHLRVSARPGPESGATPDTSLLEVTDTGHGIAPEHLPHIFEPFYTTKRGGRQTGTGLGLAMVHGIATSLKGSVSVESVPGRGTTFSVLLPVTPVEERTIAEPTTESAQIVPTGCTVLLVDEKEGVRGLTRHFLETAGHTVLAASDADAALETSRLSSDAIDVLIADLSPGQMSGPSLARALRRNRPEIRVVFMSGGDLGNVLADTGLRDLHVLQKPFSYEELAAAVSAALRRTPIPL